MDKSRDCIPFASLDRLPLNFRHSPAIDGSLVGGSNVDRWSNSRSQLIYRVAHGLAEVAQFLSTQTSFKRFADVGAVQPDIDEIQFVGH